MKKINWNTMSKLGLIERINREILHPLGLSVSRTVETGVSDYILIADDKVWEYSERMEKGKILSSDEIHEIISQQQQVDLGVEEARKCFAEMLEKSGMTRTCFLMTKKASQFLGQYQIMREGILGSGLDMPELLGGVKVSFPDVDGDCKA